MKHNFLIAQSGGPTAAINATVAGAVARAQLSEQVGTIYGAVNGVKGVLEERLVDLGAQLSSPEALSLFSRTPGAGLGSCRLKLKSLETDRAQFSRILEVFRKYDVGCFVYVGGNDSMDTVWKLSQFVRENGLDVRVMGAPKTIDNDLCGTDHTPGFGSAAKYVAATFSELACDVDVYDVKAVTIVEVMGRDAGWLTASAAAARLGGNAKPLLVYLPERPFSDERFIDDVRAALAKEDAVIVAISEGIRYADGSYVSESTASGAVDVFGHKYLSGAGKALERLVREKLGCKVRSIELNLMQRCAGHLMSAVDYEESRQLGAMAAEQALCGASGRMAAVRRLSDAPYRVSYETVGIEQVANRVSTVPDRFISEAGNDVTEAFVRYIAPLIRGEVATEFRDGVPVHFRLRK